MKNKKIRIIITITIIILLITITGCNFIKEENQNKDAIKFKEEYESLNSVKNQNNIEYRNLNIPVENPMIYSTGEEIIKMIEENESFYVYFGSKYCPWCRSVIEMALKVAKEKNIKKIYYVDIWDDDKNEILRDKYKIEDQKAVVIVEKNETYAKLLKYFDNLLSEYILTDENGNSINTNEKRIYAPNFIYIENGKSIRLTEGISKEQKNSTAELTNEILTEEKKLFIDFFK